VDIIVTISVAGIVAVTAAIAAVDVTVADILF